MGTALTFSWRKSLSYRNEAIDLQGKSMDWFLYDKDLRHTEWCTVFDAEHISSLSEKGRVYSRVTFFYNVGDVFLRVMYFFA